jgi:hypothetical protein
MQAGSTISLSGSNGMSNISPSSISITSANASSGSRTVNFNYSALSSGSRDLTLTAEGTDRNGDNVDDSDYYRQHGTGGSGGSSLVVSAITSSPVSDTTTSVTFRVTWSNVWGTVNISPSIGTASTTSTLADGNGHVDVTVTMGANTGTSSRTIRLTGTASFNSLSDYAEIVQNGSSYPSGSIDVASRTNYHLDGASGSDYFDVTWEGLKVGTTITLSGSSGMSGISPSSISVSSVNGSETVNFNYSALSSGSRNLTLTATGTDRNNDSVSDSDYYTQHGKGGSGGSVLDVVAITSSPVSDTATSVQFTVSGSNIYYETIYISSNIGTVSRSSITPGSTGSFTQTITVTMGANPGPGSRTITLTANTAFNSMSDDDSITQNAPAIVYNPDIWWTKTSGGSSSTAVNSVSDVPAYVSGTYDGRDVEYTIYLNWNSDVYSVDMDTSLINGASASRNNKTVTITVPVNSGSSRSIGSITVSGTSQDGVTYDEETLTITQVGGSSASSLLIEGVSSYIAPVNIAASGGSATYNFSYSNVADIGTTFLSGAVTGATASTSTLKLTVGFIANSSQYARSWGASITGHTVFGTVIEADVLGTQDATAAAYLYIEGESTHSATAVTHILDQEKTFNYDLTVEGIVDGTLGSASTAGHASEHGDIEGAWVGGDQFSISLDGRTLEHIGTGYVTNYIDVTGTSVNDGSTLRATLVLRIELEKVNMKFIFQTNGAPDVLASYELRVDGNTIINGSGQQTITYVAYSEHDLSVKANVTQTTSYDPQSIDVNVVGDHGIIEPNYGSVQLILPGNFGPAESGDYTTRFMGSGTVVVSFTWTQTYVYNLTTTQAGCTVVMCGVTTTTNSVANHTYSMTSVETSMSYTVSKPGYITQTGTINGPNRNVTITLLQESEEMVTIRTVNEDVIIHNRTSQNLDIEQCVVELYCGSTILQTWYNTMGANVNPGSSTRIGMNMPGSTDREVRRNSQLVVKFTIQQYSGNAQTMEFKYPKWEYNSYGTVTQYLSGEYYTGEGAMPACTEAAGAIYVFPHSAFEARFIP